MCDSVGETFDASLGNFARNSDPQVLEAAKQPTATLKIWKYTVGFR